MAMRDWSKPMKTAVKITTCHPDANGNPIVEGVRKDGYNVPIQVGHHAAAFRWPVVGEWWTVYYENNVPILGECIDEDGHPFPVTLMQPGDTRINSKQNYDRVGKTIPAVYTAGENAGSVVTYNGVDFELTDIEFPDPGGGGIEVSTHDLAPHLNQGWYPGGYGNAPFGLYVRKVNGICTVYGLLAFDAGNLTPADIAAGEPGTVFNSHYYDGVNIITGDTVGGARDVIGKNGPTVTLARGASGIPLEYSPAHDMVFRVWSDGQNSSGIYNGVYVEIRVQVISTHLNPARVGSFWSVHAQPFPPIIDAYGTPLAGVPGNSDMWLNFDGVTYPAHTP